VTRNDNNNNNNNNKLQLRNTKSGNTVYKIRENIKILAKKSVSHCELKHHKPWFDEECSKLVDRRKQANVQWLQGSSEANEKV
jgi:hypothetical protein